MPVIRLPDGSRREYPRPLTVAEIAADIGAGLARAALAGKVDGRLVDTSFLVETDADVSIVTDKTAEGLEIISSMLSDAETTTVVGEHYRVEDLGRALEHLKAAGVRLIDEAPRPGAHGTRIAFVHPKATGGVLTELVEEP